MTNFRLTLLWFFLKSLCIKFHNELGSIFDFVWCLWQANLSLLTYIHLLLTLVCVLPFMETMQSFLKFAQRRDIFIVTSLLGWNLPRSIIYFIMWQQLHNQQWQTLVLSRVVTCDHTQIHIKWVTNYNTNNSIEHCAFLLNGERCVCIGVWPTRI